MYCKLLFFEFVNDGFLRISVCFYIWTAFVCICVYECVWPWTGPIWKQLLAARALRHPQCLSLWAKRNLSPSHFSLSLSVSLCFFLSFSLFLLPLSFCLTLSLSLSGLNYFRMSPNKGARWNPFLFFYWGKKTQPYFNSHHTFPICANKPWNTSAN